MVTLVFGGGNWGTVIEAASEDPKARSWIIGLEF